MAFSIHDVYARLSPPFRRRRMRHFLETLEPTSTTTILDVGGYPSTWRLIHLRSQITVLNVHPIDHVAADDDPPIRTIVGDGCNLEFADESFDIVFSNSVIEHLGSLEKQKRFANECRRVGRHVWVQTPAKSFFIEPHLLTPFIHFLPRRVQRALIRHFTVWGLLTKPTAEGVRDFLAEVRLLRRSEMRDLFPDCRIVSERWLGLAKSYIAVR